jgi:hypothetical protein
MSGKCFTVFAINFPDVSIQPMFFFENMYLTFANITSQYFNLQCIFVFVIYAQIIQKFNLKYPLLDE